MQNELAEWKAVFDRGASKGLKLPDQIVWSDSIPRGAARMSEQLSESYSNGLASIASVIICEMAAWKWLGCPTVWPPNTCDERCSDWLVVQNFASFPSTDFGSALRAACDAKIKEMT